MSNPNQGRPRFYERSRRRVEIPPSDTVPRLSTSPRRFISVTSESGNSTQPEDDVPISQQQWVFGNIPAVRERGESSRAPRPMSEMTSHYERLEERGLGEVRVICPYTMSVLGIYDQFVEFSTALGVYQFLDELRYCKVYKEPTLNFLSSFKYKNSVVIFRIANREYRMTIEAFNTVLDFRANTRYLGNRRESQETWTHIAEQQEGEMKRGNMIRYLLVKYFYQALSNAVFARGLPTPRLLTQKLNSIAPSTRQAIGPKGSPTLVTTWRVASPGPPVTLKPEENWGTVDWYTYSHENAANPSNTTL